jgi:hypothetical protein
MNTKEMNLNYESDKTRTQKDTAKSTKYNFVVTISDVLSVKYNLKSLH